MSQQRMGNTGSSKIHEKKGKNHGCMEYEFNYKEGYISRKDRHVQAAITVNIGDRL